VFIYKWAKNRIVLKVDNFSTVRGRKACDMQRILNFPDVQVS